jgi:hypothetical protein
VGVVDFDGDDLAGVVQPDLDALADDLGAPAAGYGALHPGGTLVEDRSRAGGAGALETSALGGAQRQHNGAVQDTVEHDVGEGVLQAQGDPPAGERTGASRGLEDVEEVLTGWRKPAGSRFGMAAFAGNDGCGRADRKDLLRGPITE